MDAGVEQVAARPEQWRARPRRGAVRPKQRQARLEGGRRGRRRCLDGARGAT
jgi:hypothetical protein